jgi:hypothetical protein
MAQLDNIISQRIIYKKKRRVSQTEIVDPECFEKPEILFSSYICVLYIEEVVRVYTRGDYVYA